MNKKKSYGLNIGASSVLVIMVILSLVCFAGLSFASAGADYRLSRKLADRTTAYYEACNKAQVSLLDLSDELSVVYEISESASDYEAKIKESFADSLTFTYNMNENQALQVTVSPVYADPSSDLLYKITSWRIINLTTPELDESLPVFLGN